MARKKKDSVSIDEVREEMKAVDSGQLTVDSENEDAAEAVDPPTADASLVDGEEAPGEEGAEADEAPDEEGAEAGETPEGEGTGEGVDDCKSVKARRMLSVVLTDHELAVAAQEMVEALDDANRARSRLKQVQADVKAEVEEAMGRANDAQRLIRRKRDDREVECVDIHNYTRGRVYTQRLDTGEIVGDRGMAFYERQTEIGTSDAEDATEAETDAETLEATENDEAAEPDEETAQAEDGAPEGVEDAEEAMEADDEEAGELVGVGAGEEDGEG